MFTKQPQKHELGRISNTSFNRDEFQTFFFFNFGKSPLFVARNGLILSNKDGAYYCYFAYVLRISRYSDFLSPIFTNTGIFLRGLKLSGESRY